ncbi:hypothetical protein [Micromonospora zamorensis]|uniref:hypothetical protein n=1 Tax=Micromonospora zamorensis TaxID=709883 RepID=UPI0033B0C620
MALEEPDSLLRAVAATGASMLIKVDGERTDGVNPKIFTVVISDIDDEAGPIRLDGADLAELFSGRLRRSTPASEVDACQGSKPVVGDARAGSASDAETPVADRDLLPRSR